MKYLLFMLPVLGGFVTAQASESVIKFYRDRSTHQATGAVIQGAAPLYFRGGGAETAGSSTDTKGQALAALRQLESDIKAAGLSRRDIAFVRAYLAPDAAGRTDYAGWNQAWKDFFGADGATVPPRTTVSIPAFESAGMLIAIEAVCSARRIQGARTEPAPGNRRAGNPQLTFHGASSSHGSPGISIAPAATYYWTAGITPSALEPDMRQQATNVLQRLQENLANVGLTFNDVASLRAFIGPDRSKGGAFDYEGWKTAYNQFFNTPNSAHQPAWTVVTTPSYGSPTSRLMIEVELIAAVPKTPDQITFDSRSNPNLKAFGAPSHVISSGMAVKSGSALYFSSGTGPAVDGDMKTQALSALKTLQAHLAEAGLGFQDVIFLRAYIVPEADGSMDRAGWSAAYSSYFNTPTQPHKPARTSIAVHSLPEASWKILLDVVAAAR